MEEDIKLLKSDLSDIKSDLVTIKQDLKYLIYKLDKVDKNSETYMETADKVSNHIDFVDNVYNNIRRPLNTICGYFSKEDTMLEEKKIIKTSL